MKRIKLTLLLGLVMSLPAMAQNNNLLSEEGLKNYLQQQNFSGSVLIQKKSGEVVHLVQGTSDMENSNPIAPNARFRIASITKLFTAVMIMQLVDEDKLNLESTIDELLDFDAITQAKKITINHLLQHISGLKNESKMSYLKNYAPDGLISKYGGKKGGVPGKQFNYNNIDYLLLGRAIEAVTGKTYLENLEERIIVPLGMTDTGLITEHELPKAVVPAFTVKEELRKAEMKIHFENFWAAGSMYSTVIDLLKFVQALKQEQLVTKTGLEIMLTSSPQRGYAAMGCWTFNSPFINGQPRIMERRGGILSSTSVIMTSLDGPETLIVLSNTNLFNPDTFGVQDNTKEYLFKQLFAHQN